jgi:predicted Zn-ribbon and HTH transcriptional regulator
MSTPLIVAAALAGLVVLALLWKLLRREKPKSWIQVTCCPECGWKGQTSRYAGRCPQCNARIGDQKGARGGAR